MELELEEAIRGRYSAKIFDDEPVSREIIVKCLDAAIWAPNHHLTQPWRFIGVDGDNRQNFAGLMEQAASNHHPTPTTGRQRRKILSAPTIVVVYSEKGENPRQTTENYASTSAVVQNFLLMLHDNALGAIWRTDPIYDDADIRSRLGVAADAVFVAAVFVGHPIGRVIRRKRDSLAGKLTWWTEGAN